MEITNQKQAVSLKIQKSVALLALIIIIGLIYFANILSHSTFGLTRNQIALFIVSGFALFFIFHFLRNHNYIYYTDTGNKFILRYFSLRPFADKKNAIEFSKAEFHNYEINVSALGLRKDLVIYRKTPKGLAKYPPVSITALDRSDREKMLSSFQKLVILNQDNGG